MNIQLTEQQNNNLKKKEQEKSSNAIALDSQNNKLNEIEKIQTNISTPINQDLSNCQKSNNINNGTKNLIFSTTNKHTAHPTAKTMKFQLKTKESIIKNELKETNRNSQENSLNTCKSPTVEQNTNLLLNTSKFKETYLDLLINSVGELITVGSISDEYLNSPTIMHNIEDNDSTHKGRNGEACFNHSNESASFFNKKCENKTCAFIVEKPSEIFQAKIISQKSKSLWLCSKCYHAWKNGQYCYYCNIIYREFSFNQQYYDNKTWIECDYCNRRMHLQCEEKKGKYHNISKLNQTNDFKYMCPFCINLKAKIKKEEEEQLLRRKRGNGSNGDNGDSEKNKKKKPNDWNHFLQCDDSNEMIKEIELLTKINDNEKK